MKNTIVTLALSLTTFTMNAQKIQFTPYVNAGVSGSSGDLQGSYYGGKNGNGFHYERGTTGGYFFAKNLGIGAGVGYDVSNFEFKHLTASNGDFIYVKNQLNHFTIPVFLTFTTSSANKLAFYANAGLKVSIIIADEATEYNEVNNQEIGVAIGTDDDKKFGFIPFGEAGVSIPVSKHIAIQIGAGFQYRVNSIYDVSTTGLNERIYAIYGLAGLAIHI